MNSVLRPTIDTKAYRKLLSSTLPRVIQTEEQNESFAAQLEQLHDRGGLTPEEEHLAELLTLLIEDFEGRHYQLAPATEIQIIRELMLANGLKQTDMVDVFGTRSVVSEVLSGKRKPSKAHIQRLSAKFNVSAELFLAPQDTRIPVKQERKRARPSVMTVRAHRKS
jgi:HTH-type transcriptional regulator/antitoxin HigA